MMNPEYTFPCNADKTPLRKEWQKAVFQNMAWRSAPLVGAPTGERNGFDALDIDPGGAGWYDANFDALHRTRAHQTRRDGVHLLFQHAPGLRGSVERIAPGVDVRAEGSYVIWWPREGFAVEDAPICEWPDWLLTLATAKRTPRNDGNGRTLRSYRALGDGDGDESRAEWLADALRQMDPREFSAYADWFPIAGACKAAGISRDVFCDWSAGDPEFADDREENEKIWDSAHGVHAGALIKALSERGLYRPTKQTRPTEPTTPNTPEGPSLPPGAGFPPKARLAPGASPTRSLRRRASGLWRWLAEVPTEHRLFVVAATFGEMVAERAISRREANY
jgi:hypothetical protein